MAAEDVRVKLLKGRSFEGAGRFLGAVQNTGFGYGTIQLPMNLWTADGTNPPVYTADAGTDGTQQHPQFAFSSATDDVIFNRFYVPLDYNMQRGEMWFVFTAQSTNHDNSVFMEWNVGATIIPTTISTGSTEEFATNIKMDTAVTSCNIQDLYVHETTVLTKSFYGNLCDGITPEPGDYILLKVFNDASDSDVTGSYDLVGACIHYSR